MNLRNVIMLTLAVWLLGQGLAAAAEKDTRVYEMRTYYSPAGKLDALHARFRNHTVKLFEKHGITNIGYWVPLDNPDNKLIYIVAHDSREAAAKSWKAFGADPEWQKVRKETEANGPIVSKVESVYLAATDYSPAIKVEQKGERVFELRDYTASPGKLDNLNARFRNHTVKLLEKHGMTNIGYWVPVKGQKGENDKLIYIMGHKSKEAADASWTAFRKDPDWLAARKASEEKAGGSLTVKDGVKSVFMKATDYSPLK